jgi:hypothetical protein
VIRREIALSARRALERDLSERSLLAKSEANTKNQKRNRAQCPTGFRARSLTAKPAHQERGTYAVVKNAKYSSELANAVVSAGDNDDITLTGELTGAKTSSNRVVQPLAPFGRLLQWPQVNCHRATDIGRK